MMAFESKFMSVEHFLRKISGLEKEILLVDHNYVKAWNAHPDSHRTKPARLLFMKGLQRYPLLSDSSNTNEDVDIETCEESLTSPFDNPKIRALVGDCEKSLKSLPSFKERDIIDDELDLSQFSSNQRKLYQQVIQVLDGDKLAKLSSIGTPNEPIKRRLAIDKAARHIRQIFGLVFWNIDLLSWLHRVLLNTLDISTVSTYVEVLQALKSKVPTLVDRILQSYAGSALGDTIIQMMKKTWEPVLPILNQNKPRKLPGDPILLICPSSPNQNAVNSHSQRLRFWQNTMSTMCKVMNIPIYSEDGKRLSTFEDYLEMMISCIRTKVTELKNHYPNRPLILLGWTIGALIACHIALQEPIDGVICVGFPLTGINGSRGDLNDPLLDNKIPTLFMVGQNARMCSTDDVEDFRSRMRAETGLVVVGGADDLLRMCPQKMKLEGVTQAMVDRCLLDEISDFLMSVVIKLPSTSAMSTALSPAACAPIQEEEEEVVTEEADETPKSDDKGKRRRRKPREYSPELSPVRKRPRHHSNRQPTSGVKARLSPSSSETSSSGSNEKSVVAKPAKKNPEKRIGRPSSGTWRRRTPSKTISLLPAPEISAKKILTVEEQAPPIPTKPKETPIPFSKAILPKKNAPVDIEKAFGSDSSFLPRPLTPPEPEDTISAEETEKVLAELEEMAAGGSSETISHESVCDRAFLPIAAEKETEVITTTSTVDLEQSSPPLNPTINTSPPSKTVESPSIVSRSPSLASILTSQSKVTQSQLQALKNAGGISLLSNPSPTASPKSTIITIPAASAATLLASNPSLKTSAGKVIQILAKSTSSSTSPKNASKEPAEHRQPQSCNLSLLSDVAGMTEPIKKSETLTSSATLVKLAVPEKSQFPPNIKCLKVIKTVSSSNLPSMRVETNEEMMEKQLAIQALNKSIGLEPSTPAQPAKESGYSICYAKADGSIVSRAVNRPNAPGYGPTATRGKPRNPTGNRTFHQRFM